MAQEFKLEKRRSEAAGLAATIGFGVVLALWSILTASGIVGVVR